MSRDFSILPFLMDRKLKNISLKKLKTLISVIRGDTMLYIFYFLSLSTCGFLNDIISTFIWFKTLIFHSGIIAWLLLLC